MQVIEYIDHTKGTRYMLSEAPNFEPTTSEILNNAFKDGLSYSQIFSLCLNAGNSLNAGDLETLSAVFKATAKDRLEGLV